MNGNKVAIGVVVVIVVAAGIFLLVRNPSSTSTLGGNTPIASASYVCDQGKTIQASYYQGTTTPTMTPGQPPTPNGTVTVKLSDGRTLMLNQTISADGTRYSNGDPQAQQGQPGAETFVFWSKGNGAFVLENNQTQTYTGCIAVASDPGGLPNVYQNGTEGITIRYPNAYTMNDSYKYQELGPDKTISGVEFTIAPSIAQGTNLGSDSYLSVEQIPQTTQCTADLFLDSGAVAQTVTDNGTTYSFASSTGAGAGNRYEESVYAIPGTNPCTAIRYFIHYSVLDNYPPGAVQAFDETALKAQFDAMRGTLTISQ